MLTAYHCNVQPHTRTAGHSATAAAAYRSGTCVVDERTGEVHDYTRKEGVEYTEIITPEGSPEWAQDRAALWNESERVNTRKNSRVCRDVKLAFPTALDFDQRQAMVRDFGHMLVERHGVAVDIAMHEPDRQGDSRNYHAHVLVTTHRLGPEGFTEKARELDDRQRGPQEIEAWREAWAAKCAEALREAGHHKDAERWLHGHKKKDEQIQLAVDRGDLDFARQAEGLPTIHMGPAATESERQGVRTDRGDTNREIIAANAREAQERLEQADAIVANPGIVLENITRMKAVFDRRDIARELNRYIDDPAQFQNLLARLEASPELVQLVDEQREGNRTEPAKYSTREMIDTEQAMIGAAERLAVTRGHEVDPNRIRAVIVERPTLSDEQRQALEHVTGGGNLAVVIGDAGTGKSFAMAAARQAWESEGFRVRGAALSGKAADELQNGSGIESRTLHSLEYAWSSGRDPLTKRDVIVVDEAGMVGSRQLGRILAAADQAGAKVVLLGDDKQLAAIEAGAGFRAIQERVGAAEITQIRRQREAWAREASTELARGDVRAGLDAYQERGAVQLHGDREAAKKQLASDYLRDRDRSGSSIILAHSNADVASLNATIRQARLDAGELGQAMDVETARGGRQFGTGDRMVFLKNDAKLDVKNGSLGTVTAAEDGRLTVMLDNGREVAFAAQDYQHVDHGYAVTVHKSQGVTVDRAYVLATPSMDRSLAYVAMTRHKENATMYAGKDDFGSYDKLANGLSRQRPKETTLDFAERHGIEAGDAGQHQAPPTTEAMPSFAEQFDKKPEGYQSLFGEKQESTQSRFAQMKKEAKAQSGELGDAGQEQSAAEGSGRFAEMKRQAASQGKDRLREQTKELDSATLAKLIGDHAQASAEAQGKTLQANVREKLEAKTRERIDADPQAKAKLAERIGEKEGADAGQAQEKGGRFADMKREAEAQRQRQTASKDQEQDGPER